MTTLCVIQGCRIAQLDSGAVDFLADADIDADGCNGQSVENGQRVWAYKVGNKGLEDLANAGYPAHHAWYRNILLCDPNGTPMNFPGGGIASRTTYEWFDKKPSDPARWVDSFGVPYVVVSPTVRIKARGIVLGCACRVTNTVTGRSVEGVVADIGPLRKIGEISMAAAKAIGIPWDPRRGGVSGRTIKYELFPGRPAVVNGVTYNLIRA